MALKTQIGIKQQLAMTQGLQQTIRILQLTQQELATELEAFLDSNIMLELEKPEEDALFEENWVEEASFDQELDFADEGVEIESAIEYASDDNPQFQQESEEYDPFNLLSSLPETSLKEDLMWQLELAQPNERDFIIGAFIINALTESGYFIAELEEFCQEITPHLPNTSIEEVEAMLKRIQQFEPSGIAAQSLEECLITQIKDVEPEPLWANDAITLLLEGKEALERLDLPRLSRLISKDEKSLRAILKEIESLNPHPGLKGGDKEVATIKPEIIVTVDRRRIEVKLNEEVVPKLHINKVYASLAKEKGKYISEKESKLLKTHLFEAKGIIYSLKSRFEAILLVAEEIIRHQRAFFFEGESALKPLRLANIAERLDLSESTISRAINGKYLTSVAGTYELKYFFTNRVEVASDDESVSSAAIRAALGAIIEKENPERPLSDTKLAALLAAEGYPIARRTVAKYRSQLGIVSSTERRTLNTR